jgi:hypothetical protein
MAEKPVGRIEQMLKAEYPSLLWHHCPDSRGCHGPAGLPDFIVVGPRGIICREGKPPGQHARGRQVEWGYALQAVGVSCSVWTAEDMFSGLVRAELEALL